MPARRFLPLFYSLCLSTAALNAPYASAADFPTGAGFKAPPRVQAIPEPRHGVSFVLDGRKVLGFDAGGGMQRPFLYPVIGPSGHALTRMGHPHDPVSHSHHNSIWISHAEVEGHNFWADQGGTIEVTQITRLEDADESAFVEFKAVWKTKDLTPLLNENRRVTLSPAGTNQWRIDIEIELLPAKDPVTFGATAFGLLGVRMAKTIGVIDGGGRILNSEGAINEAGCFRKPARWVDYSGPVTATLGEGITLMDHPDNLHHPVEFHVRNDGWMGAATTFRGPHTVESGAPLRLKYGLLIHSGDCTPETMQHEWERFARFAFKPFPTKPR